MKMILGRPYIFYDVKSDLIYILTKLPSFSEDSFTHYRYESSTLNITLCDWNFQNVQLIENL